MVHLTFYGGVNEIGGNKILLEDQGTKIFLDFGMSFKRRGKYFEEFLNPRTANGIGDFLEMELIPDVPGIYRTDLLGERPCRDRIFRSLPSCLYSRYSRQYRCDRCQEAPRISLWK